MNRYRKEKKQSMISRMRRNKWSSKGISGILTLLFLLITLSFGLPMNIYADDTVLKVGYSDSDGILVDENGEYSGYAVGYLEELSRYTGWKYEFVYDSWKNCMDRLESGELDLLVMTHYTEERGKRFLYSNLSMGHNYTVLYTNADSDIYYQDYNAFDGCRIGVAAETSFEMSLEAYLKELNLNCEIVPFDSETLARAALARGDVEMIAASFFSYHSDVKLVDRFQLRRAYFAVGKQNQELMDELNVAMQEARIENRDLEAKLLKTHYNVSKDISNLYLTREERLYLDSAQPIVVKGFDDRKPMGYTDEEGNFKGILVDYLNLLGEMSGLEFVYEPADSMSLEENVSAMEEEGYCLLFMDQSLDELGLEGSLYKSDGLFDTALAYIKREGEVVTKYDPHTFAINSEMEYVGELLLGTNSESTILYYDTSVECMEAVLYDVAEMAILEEHIAAYLLQKPIFDDNLAQVPGSGAFTGGMCLYAPPQHQHLVSILNKTLEHISEKQRLYMVSNATLSHSYEYQLEDVLYEYGNLIRVSVVLLVIILVLGSLLYVRINRLKTQKKETEALQKRIQLDELTGVYSRKYFFEKVQEMIDQDGEDLWIVRLNISHFKVINELYGSEKGDQLLQEIGHDLNKSGLKNNYIAGRFTADHFYLCIHREDFERARFPRKVFMEWINMDVTFTYGVYRVDLQKEIPVSTMCDRADMAIAFNKQQGSSEYIYYYSDEFRQQLLHEQEIESEMELALSERQFCIYIQPKYDIESEQLVGGEALVRWIHPQKGLIPPGEFIDIFEKNGFIKNLDYYVWEESCRFLSEARKKGLPIFPLSVNVSRIHFYSKELQEKLLSLLGRYHLRAEDLELEITENVYAEEPEMIFDQCKQLQEFGFKIAMDDFGSGYSSLNMLKRMPLDIIKMDLKFLSDDEDRGQMGKGREILRTQIELAHMLGIQVVVEGLETEEHKRFIRSIGNCVAQGYYYSKPVDCQSYEAMLKKSIGE